MLRLLSYMVLIISTFLVTSCEDKVSVDNSDTTEMDSLLLQGIEETSRLNFEKAHSSLTSLLSIAEDQDNSKYQILANLNLGGLYHHFNAQDDALKYFFQSLDVAEKTGNDQYLNSIYNNLGIVYMQNDAYEQAAEYVAKALEISLKRNEQGKIGMNLINLGITMDMLQRDEEAVARFEEAKTIFLTSNDSTKLSAAINNIGNVYFEQGKYSIAFHNFLEAYQLSSKNDEAWYRWEYSLNLGKSYYYFNRLDSARFYILQAIDGYGSTGNTSMLIDSYTWLSRVEKKSGNFTDALSYYEQTLALKDTLLTEKTTKWVSELQMNYEFGKKEKEIELLQDASSKRQTIWMGAVSGGLAIVFLLIITMRTNNKNLRQKNVILEQEQAVAQLTIDKNKAQREKLQQEMETQERLNALERQKLQQEIEFRDRELVGKAMHLVNKNEIFSSLQNMLGKWGKKGTSERESAIYEAQNLLKSAKNMDEDWESFKIHFEEVNPNFFSTLSKNYSELTPGDFRMCAYLTLNLSAKEIAQILNISPESVRKRKQRLKEKLGLERNQDLTDWLRKLSNK